MRASEIEVRDLNGARIFHGYQLDNSQEWHVSGVRYVGVLIAIGPGELGRMISEQVAGMERWSVHTHAVIPGETHPRYTAHDCYPDPMGCVVMDGEFLGYAEFMRRIIPQPVDLTGTTD